MPTLKDFGIELQSFAPIPNSIIVGRFKFQELDLEGIRQIGINVKSAFDEQGCNNRVIFIPKDLEIQRMSLDGIIAVRDHINELIEEYVDDEF